MRRTLSRRKHPIHVRTVRGKRCLCPRTRPRLVCWIKETRRSVCNLLILFAFDHGQGRSEQQNAGCRDNAKQLVPDTLVVPPIHCREQRRCNDPWSWKISIRPPAPPVRLSLTFLISLLAQIRFYGRLGGHTRLWWM